MRKYESVGFAVPDVMLPKKGADLYRWAVVACDQYTSQPDYWARVKDTVADAPSTLHLVYPEVFLNESENEKEARIKSIHDTMGKYLADGIFETYEGLIYVERTVDDRVRRGIVGCIDLERYSFKPGSTSLVRATEGTILERIPPRVRIRKGAPMEFPHILILVDDPKDTMLAPLQAGKDSLTKLYDFDLMEEGGHLAGFLVDSLELEEKVVAALEQLAQPNVFIDKYGVAKETPVLLYAVGDGNHSLATAKTIWEDAKKEGATLDSPLRWALVEYGNLHDPALIFEPIHRLMFDLPQDYDIVAEFTKHYAGKVNEQNVADLKEMEKLVATSTAQLHKIGVICPKGLRVLEVAQPGFEMPVATLQTFLDPVIQRFGLDTIDYIHGADVLESMAKVEGKIGFLLPAMDKNDLFKSVIMEGALQRKTFSMGDAHEKRFYLEGRCLE